MIARNVLPYLFLIVLIGCQKNESGSLVPEGQYVGRERCISCHKEQYDLYAGSDHDLAMDVANEKTVLGDFNNRTFTQHGITSKFYKRDEKFFVFTEGPDGNFQEFEIKYVLGVRPLQQYLVEFPDGRLQTLPLCWDTRPRKQGGQRWFHIYGDERIGPEDILYWTKPSQNWNYMCAECHTTNLRKNFDYKTNTYNTTWSEIDVSCEACHGPGSRHVDWAEARKTRKEKDSYTRRGLAIQLKEDDQGGWVIDKKTGNARRIPSRKSNTQVEMCARCHSRRSVIHEEYRHIKPFLDTHRPSLLEERLYYADGQILEEVYEYASFLQSKMYRAGVVCTDCHDPHSTKRYEQGDALCYRCHMAEKFGSSTHHFHKKDSKGSRCIACHMLERTYMVVDPRYDHSFRIPRPDLSEKLGTPNTCSNCHTNKPNRWATDYVKKWYGIPHEGEKHYGEIFWAGRRSDPSAHGELIELIRDENQPAIVRATALLLLRNYPNEISVEALKKALKGTDPLIRSSAIHSIDILPPDRRVEVLVPLLKDPVRLVRTQAARHLAAASSGKFSSHDLKLLKEVLAEYEQTQYINADNPAAYMNLGVLRLEQGAYGEAEVFYKKALETEPSFVLGYINLADLYRMENRDAEGKTILLKALDIAPKSAPLHHALGLLLIRMGEREKALDYLARAVGLDPRNGRYNYVYGIALNSTGKTDQAIFLLQSALQDNPYDQDLLFSLATIYRDRGELKRAQVYARRLVEGHPENPDYRILEEQLSKD
jgi:predicted CXXCH cytochrome family protein